MDNNPPPASLWARALVPKRHARRAVTRNQLKRQIRAAFVRHEARLPQGLWLVRLRRPFPPQRFVSARSEAIAQAVRLELDALFTKTAESGSKGRARP